LDGFDQDHAASEGDEGSVILHGLLTAHGNTLEALQLADRLFDTGSAFLSKRTFLPMNAGAVLPNDAHLEKALAACRA
jgi:hypothetical protein